MELLRICRLSSLQCFLCSLLCQELPDLHDHPSDLLECRDDHDEEVDAVDEPNQVKGYLTELPLLLWADQRCNICWFESEECIRNCNEHALVEYLEVIQVELLMWLGMSDVDGIDCHNDEQAKQSLRA